MLPALNEVHDILLEFLKNKKLAAIFIIYFIAVSFLFVQITHAFFTDTAVSSNNTFTAAEVFPPGPGDVVINEIMWAGSSLNINDEWVELRNMTSSPIDLSGWTLEGAGAGSNIITISSGTIPGNGFFLISNFDDTHPTSILNVTPDITNTTIQLDNNDLQIVLKDASSIIIDTADDGSGSPFAGSNTTPKKSMERKDPSSDGTSAANWHTSTGSANLDPSATESATPRTTNSSGL